MKRSRLNLVVAFFVATLMALSVNAEEEKGSKAVESANIEVSKESTTESALEIEMKVEKILTRLNEIKEMDIEALDSKEKKELRKEVRSIRKDLKSYSDSNATAKAAAEAGATRGIFISTGAAIIIVLLLILLI